MLFECRNLFVIKTIQIFNLCHKLPITTNYYLLLQQLSLLGATNGERKEVSEAIQICDKAYTYLKLAVNEIRGYP